MISYSNENRIADDVEFDHYDLLKEWWNVRRKKKLVHGQLPWTHLKTFIFGKDYTVETIVSIMREEIKEFKNREVQEILDIL